jgi:hypothetical protein
MTRLLAFAALALVACSHSDDKQVDAPVATDASVKPDGAPQSWPLALPLHGCSWMFTAAIDIGGSPFQLLVDTGSPGLAVAAAGCTTCMSDGVTTFYQPGATATDLHEPTMGDYDGGNMTWTGEAYNDAVGVGNASTPMMVNAISSEKNFFFENSCTAFDGISGMQGTTSLPAALATTGAPDVFTMHECLGSGTLWLGGYDATAMTGAPVMVDMPNDYSVGLTDVAIGGTSVGLPASTYGQAIVDSGGPTIFLPQAAFNTISTALDANATFTAQFGSASWLAGGNCTQATLTKAQLDAALPPLGLSFGSVSVQLPATDSYLMAIGDGTTATTYCPALDTSADVTFTDLGNSLIRSQVVIFDRANRQLGLAPTAPCI